MRRSTGTEVLVIQDYATTETRESTTGVDCFFQLRPALALREMQKTKGLLVIGGPFLPLLNCGRWPTACARVCL